MKTIEINLYKFNELNEEAKQKALEKLRDINVEYFDWWEPVYETEIQELETKGFNNISINFSGFWSQGDGASFTGNLDIIKWIEQDISNKYRRLIPLFKSGIIEVDRAEIRRDRNTHYVHENTTTFYLEVNMYGNLGTSAINVSNLITELEEEIQTSLYILNKNIYKALEKYYDELTKKEAIIETIEANNYDFTEQGEIY